MTRINLRYVTEVREHGGREKQKIIGHWVIREESFLYSFL